MRGGPLLPLDGRECDNDVNDEMQENDCSSKRKMTPAFYWIRLNSGPNVQKSDIKIIFLKTSEMRPEFQRKEKSTFDLRSFFRRKEETVN